MSATTFEYAVRDRGGKVVTGRMDADSEAAVAGKLRGMGYAPISISQTNAGMKKELSLPSFNKRVKLIIVKLIKHAIEVRRRDISQFTQSPKGLRGENPIQRGKWDGFCDHP